MKGNQVLGIEEKPKKPKSNLAVTGLYLYDAGVFEGYQDAQAVWAGGTWITDVNNAYIRGGDGVLGPQRVLERCRDV